MQLAGAQPFQRLLRNARPSALVDYPQVTTLAVIRVGSPWTTSRHPLRNLIQPNESIGSGYALQLRSRIVGCASASIRARRVAFQELAEGFAIACGRHATTSPNLRGESAAGSELRMRIRVSPEPRHPGRQPILTARMLRENTPMLESPQPRNPPAAPVLCGPCIAVQCCPPPSRLTHPPSSRRPQPLLA